MPIIPAALRKLKQEDQEFQAKKKEKRREEKLCPNGFTGNGVKHFKKKRERERKYTVTTQHYVRTQVIEEQPQLIL
jgi:hypothetical protein